MDSTHYNKEYFEYQDPYGDFGGKANLFLFKKHITNSDSILDFGCGGGQLLTNIDTTGTKYGIEINDIARNKAEKSGIKCFKTTEEVNSELVDVVISNMAIEHVDNPAHYIKELKRITKIGGKIIIVVPNEVWTRVRRDDKCMHLFTWAPQNMYNLCKFCGLEVISSKRVISQWMPHFKTVQKIFGWKIFRVLCFFACLVGKGYQTKCVCIRKE